MIYVSQEDLYRGVGKEMKSTVRRIRWSRTVDHSVLSLTLPLYGSRPDNLPPMPVRVKSLVKRFKLPCELLCRAAFLSIIGLAQDTSLSENPMLKATDAWPCAESYFISEQQMDELRAIRRRPDSRSP